MKTEPEIEKRLQKLRSRYKRKWVHEKAGRKHRNCVHNYEHSPAGQFKYSKSHDVDLAPRKQVTLMVIQPEAPVTICTYDSKSKDWNGDICDTDEKAAECPWFKPALSEAAAEAEFEELLADDEFVFENYRDVATLQWVLDVRVASTKIPFWERFFAWFKYRPKELPAPAEPDVPEGLWDADPKDS